MEPWLGFSPALELMASTVARPLVTLPKGVNPIESLKMKEISAKLRHLKSKKVIEIKY